MVKRPGHCENPICQRQFQAHYTVREIAFFIGYEPDTSFVRAFKLYFNCSPGKINK